MPLRSRRELPADESGALGDRALPSPAAPPSETHYGFHLTAARWWIFEGSEQFECIMAGRFKDLIKDAPYEGSESLPLIGLKHHWDAAVANLIRKVKG